MLRKPTESHTNQYTTCSETTSKRSGSLGSVERIRIKLQNQWNSLPWERLKTVKWKNERVTKPGVAYTPTEVRFFRNFFFLNYVNIPKNVTLSLHFQCIFIYKSSMSLSTFAGTFFFISFSIIGVCCRNIYNSI